MSKRKRSDVTNPEATSAGTHKKIKKQKIKGAKGLKTAGARATTTAPTPVDELKAPENEERASKIARREAKKARKRDQQKQKERGEVGEDGGDGTQVKKKGSGNVEDLLVKNNVTSIDGRGRESQSKVEQERQDNEKNDGGRGSLQDVKIDESKRNEQVALPRKKRKKKDSLKGAENDSNHEAIEQTDLVVREPKKKKKDANAKADRKDIRDKRKHREAHVISSTWKVSDPVGGQMQDLDPLFSPDQNHLLIAYQSAIAVYSTSTSLLVRRLQVKKASSITAFAFSSLTTNQIYVSTISGIIEKWDWIKGSRLSIWKLSSPIYSLVTSVENVGDAETELVYTVDKKDHGPWLLSAHRLDGGESTAKTNVKTLYQCKEPLSNVKILRNGCLIVATSGSNLIMGTSDVPNPPSLGEISYSWRINECPEWIVSIDVRLRQHDSDRKKADPGKAVYSGVNIALGGLKGSIHIYDDLLANLIRMEKITKKNGVENTISRRLHWHRNAVLAVKWSLDGNYIISGGQETTFVLWQLETGHKQMLPHLGASVDSVVVSPTGSSYAIRLADNSAMILSTTELRPTFSVAGIQLPARKSNWIQIPSIPTVDTVSQKDVLTNRPQLPACVGSMSSANLLLAVPPSSSLRSSQTTSFNASYLQSFDLISAHQLSRQALTRTKITTLNMGPESNIINEPNVTHMQTSADGKWLATVDEWVPPTVDLAPLAFNEQRTIEEQIFRQESYLKFWAWNDVEKVWELTFRIDNPHASESGSPYDRRVVFDLTSDPSGVGFATIGEDGFVKIWRPAKRRRNGLEVRGKDGTTLTSWLCNKAVPLDSALFESGEFLLGAKLVYSLDGSVLAAGVQGPDPSPIHLIDALDGEVRSVHSGLYTGPLLGLGVIHKYLVILSNDLCVWNLVTNELHYGINLRTSSLPLPRQMTSTHLAVDMQRGLFAIAMPEAAKNPQSTTSLTTQCAIFDPEDPSPLFTTSLPNSVTTLLPATTKKGFYAIDSAAEIRTLTPSYSIPAIATKPHKDNISRPGGITNLFGNGQPTRPKDEDDASKNIGLLDPPSPTKTFNAPRAVNHADAVHVTQDQLAAVFDVGPAFKLPPVEELFKQVAGLYIGRKED